jgi:hypothetical protein
MLSSSTSATTLRPAPAGEAVHLAAWDRYRRLQRLPFVIPAARVATCGLLRCPRGRADAYGDAQRGKQAATMLHE